MFKYAEFESPGAFEVMWFRTQILTIIIYIYIYK